MSDVLEAPAKRKIIIRVEGIPAPQGSKAFKGMTKNGHAILVESSKKVKPWREEVVKAAKLAIERDSEYAPLAGPLVMSIMFFLPRGKTVKREWPTTYPDNSKLIRSTEDALTEAKVWFDDAQVVKHREVTKQYASAEHPPGALIHVETM